MFRVYYGNLVGLFSLLCNFNFFKLDWQSLVFLYDMLAEMHKQVRICGSTLVFPFPQISSVMFHVVGSDLDCSY